MCEIGIFIHLLSLLFNDQPLCLKLIQQCPTVAVGAPELVLLIGLDTDFEYI
jgi:hypothetical protein